MAEWMDTHTCYRTLDNIQPSPGPTRLAKANWKPVSRNMYHELSPRTPSRFRNVPAARRLPKAPLRNPAPVRILIRKFSSPILYHLDR